MMAWSGCAIRQAEECCPTDIRKMQHSVGEDAIRQSPCGPDCGYYGHKPTCWREWPASWPLYKQHVCAAAPETCHPMVAEDRGGDSEPTLATPRDDATLEVTPTPAPDSAPLPPLPPGLPQNPLPLDEPPQDPRPEDTGPQLPQDSEPTGSPAQEAALERPAANVVHRGSTSSLAVARPLPIPHEVRRLPSVALLVDTDRVPERQRSPGHASPSAVQVEPLRVRARAGLPDDVGLLSYPVRRLPEVPSLEAIPPLADLEEVLSNAR